MPAKWCAASKETRLSKSFFFLTQRLKAGTDEINGTRFGIKDSGRKEENKLRQTLARIEELIVEYDVKEIVLGLPLNMDGTEGERAALSLEFKDKLERRTGLPVHMWDERLTTVEAIEIMDADGIKPKDREKYVDMIAARVILEGYMENGNKQ